MWLQSSGTLCFAGTLCGGKVQLLLRINLIYSFLFPVKYIHIPKMYKSLTSSSLHILHKDLPEFNSWNPQAVCLHWACPSSLQALYVAESYVLHSYWKKKKKSLKKSILQLRAIGMKSVFLCNGCAHMSWTGAVLGTGCSTRELDSLALSVHLLLNQSISEKGTIYLLLDKDKR